MGWSRGRGWFVSGEKSCVKAQNQLSKSADLIGFTRRFMNGVASHLARRALEMYKMGSFIGRKRVGLRS